MAGLFAVALVGSVYLEYTGLDLAMPAHFYESGAANGGWKYGRLFPWGFLYKYGEYISIAPGLWALVALFRAFARGKGLEYVRSACILSLTMILGPGLLVNGLLKPYWGRPRPADIVQFGGTSEYRSFLQPGGPGAGKSFTCGHCAAGFALTALGTMRSVRPITAIVCVGAGLVFGGLLSATRLVQGGHFPTDIIWSAALTLIIVVGLSYLVFPPNRRIPAMRHAPPD
jgi:membrane-associated PAP2 superfamily phosphatase